MKLKLSEPSGPLSDCENTQLCIDSAGPSGISADSARACDNREHDCPLCPWGPIVIASGAQLTGGDFGPDTETVIHRSATSEGVWNATRFIDEEGELFPIGHTEYTSLRDALSKELRWGSTFKSWLQE